jgi:hypothetical protein
MFEGDYTIYGKHATYAKALKLGKEESDVEVGSETKEDLGIFYRIIDVYMVGAIVGFLHGRKAERDTTSNDRVRVYAAAFGTEKLRCDFIYRLIMLLDETTGYNMEQRIDRAFRDDSKPDNAETKEVMKNNMDLFHSYVLGGIEVLQEMLRDDCVTKDDYINKIHEFTSNFKEEIDGVPYSERIREVMSDYTVG